MLKCLIRLKIKGDHRIKLTCKDRKEYLTLCGIKAGEDYLVKLLRESGPSPGGLHQHTLDQLVIGVGFRNWNELLRRHPMQEELPCLATDELAMAQIDERVVKRINESRNGQLELPLFTSPDTP